ncbi:hypothetical protein BGX23_004914 [Mortierella sp. AD031]|nr:hypothetical protein BGX23_004914 [Mortierella sp. AD031]
MNSEAITALPLVDIGYDKEYYGLVNIGNPPQTVKLQFDTGSSRFVVSTIECPDCSGDAHFNRTLSPTFREGTVPWKFQYGDGSYAQGLISEDSVTLGNITVQNQKLNLVLLESPNFDDVVDGVMGLSFGAISGSTTVFESEVIFGGMDMDRVEPGNDITYTPVTEAAHWNIAIQDFVINGKSFKDDQKTSPTRSIIPGARLYHKKEWIVPCTNNATLSVVIEGKSFLVPTVDLTSEFRGSRRCFSAVQSSSADYLILGDVFLKNNYVVFDQADKRVEFAPLKAEIKRVVPTDTEDEGENGDASNRVQEEL